MNILRENMPDLHEALVDNMTDAFVYQPAGGEPFTVNLITTPPSEDDAIQTKFTTLEGRRSDFPVDPKRGDRCSFNGVIYRVFDRKQNQYGWLTIQCEVTSDQSL